MSRIVFYFEITPAGSFSNINKLQKKIPSCQSSSQDKILWLSEYKDKY